jgi:xanthine/uracil/vitamin C permease (AzgA family)
MMGTHIAPHAFETHADRATAVGRMWLWPVSILVGFPIGGYVAHLVVDGVDSWGAAVAAGLISGAIFGAAEWFALRRWVSWLWIPATTAGMTVGLSIGAAVAGYGIGRGDLALMGAVTGLGVGVVQALVLARHRVRGAFWWAIVNPPGWALGWFVSSFVIARNIAERFPIFGASGALVFGLLSWLVLATLFRETRLEDEWTRLPSTA